MKLTWFGAETFRIYIGGKIVVSDGAGTVKGFDAQELRAGADFMIDAQVRAALPVFAGETWRKPAPVRLFDDREPGPLDLFSFGNTGLVLADIHDGVLIVAPADSADWGRFADGSVIVFFGDADACIASVKALAFRARPKLIALAIADVDEKQMQAFASAASGTPMHVLEPGLALEV